MITTGIRYGPGLGVGIGFLLVVLVSLSSIDSAGGSYTPCGTTLNGIDSAGMSDAEKLERLRRQYDKCRVIHGNLVIAWFQSATMRNFTFLRNVEEITGYLLVFRNEMLEALPLPRLVLVRGKQKYCGNSVLVISNPGLRSLNFRNLSEVQDGNVLVHGNSRLCYCDTIYWPAILTAGTSTCSDNGRNCSVSCGHCESQHCWGRSSLSDLCQPVTKCNGCSRCFGTDASQCCSEECAAGCTGYATNCTKCRYFDRSGVCVSSCKATSPRQADWYQEDSKCVPRCHPEHVLHHGMCLKFCPTGYRNVSSVCQYCGQNCEKTCILSGSILRGRRIRERDTRDCSVIEPDTTIDELANCTTLVGNLQINPLGIQGSHDYKALSLEDLSILKSVRKVTGHVWIQLPKSSTINNLGFLGNLEEIGYDGFGMSLSIVDQSGSLTELQMKRLRFVDGFKLQFLTRSCIHESVQWRSISSASVSNSSKLMPMVYNTSSCESKQFQCHELCHVDYGCWGGGDDMCLRCAPNAYYNAESNRCVPNCSSIPNTFAVAVANSAAANNSDNSTAASASVQAECRACHSECMGGCSGPEASDCFQCKYARLSNGSCVNRCPSDPDENCKLTEWPKNCGPGCEQCASSTVCLRCSSGRMVDHLTLNQVSDNPEVDAHDLVRRWPCIESHVCPSSHWSLNHSFNESYLDFIADDAGNTSWPLGQYLRKLQRNFSEQTWCVSCTACRDCSDSVAIAQCAISTVSPGMFLLQVIQTHLPLVGAVTVLVCVALTSFVIWWRRKARAVQRSHELSLRLLTGDKAAAFASDSSNGITELHASELTNGVSLGIGSFGAVFRATWSPKGHKWATVDVVAKRLFVDADSFQNRRVLQRQLKRLASVRHTNLAWLIGIRLEGHVIELVTQYGAIGSAREYVALNSGAITAEQMLGWFSQMAAAMNELETRGLVHGNLAARNVLLYNAYLAKVSDYGMFELFESLDGTAAVCNRQLDANTRWIAYECLNGIGFTSKSDVWSFAVAVWELCQFGKLPYPDLEMSQIRHWLEKGERLSQPASCTIDIYVLLLRCWMVEPACRPSFADLAAAFERMAKEPTRFLLIGESAKKLSEADTGTCDLSELVESGNIAEDNENIGPFLPPSSFSYNVCTSYANGTSITGSYLQNTAGRSSYDESDKVGHKRVSMYMKVGPEYQNDPKRAKSYSELAEVSKETSKRSRLRSFKSLLPLLNVASSRASARLPGQSESPLPEVFASEACLPICSGPSRLDKQRRNNLNQAAKAPDSVIAENPLYLDDSQLRAPLLSETENNYTSLVFPAQAAEHDEEAGN